MQDERTIRCPLCGRSFSFDGFPRNRGDRRGRGSYCRECSRSYNTRMRRRRQAVLNARAIQEREREVARTLDHVPSDFGHWLAGFIDGEGCFSILYRSTNRTYACGLTIALRDDDAAVLEAIRETLGFGSLSAIRRSASKRGFDTKPGALWRAGTRLDCLRLVRLLDRYPLRAKKARDFTIWREAVAVWLGVHQGGHGGINAARWQRMADLKTMLSETRRYQGSVLVIPEPVEDQPVSTGGDLLLL